MPTPDLRPLVDGHLEGGLEKYLDYYRDLGLSWARIAELLEASIGWSPTSETLRQWYALYKEEAPA